VKKNLEIDIEENNGDAQVDNRQSNVEKEELRSDIESGGE